MGLERPAVCFARAFFAAVALLSIAPLPSLAGTGPDGIELTVARDPGGGVLLEWTGGQPTFEAFRSTSPVGVTGPLNKIGETGSRDWVDTPPPGASFFYAIASTCTLTPPEVCDVTGTWVGVLDFEGSVRPIALRLHQRSGGSLLGYVMGETHRRTIVNGVYGGGSMSLELEWTTAEGHREIHLSGSVSGETLTGTATGDIVAQPVTLVRREEVLHERRFIFVDFAVGENESNELGVVLDSTGGFVAGGFSGSPGCGLWACDGGVTSFSESGGILVVGLETDGGCSASSELTATFDTDTHLYMGSYDFTSCTGSSSGGLIGARTTRTRTDHVAQTLRALGGIADQFEAGTFFTIPHQHFVDDYLHNGKDLATLFAEWNAELAAYTDIEASFRRIKMISTVEEPEAFSMFETTKGAIFDVMRAGTPSAGGTFGTYLDSSTDSLFNLVRNELRVFEPAGGWWKVGGDRQPTLDLPWIYSVSSDGRLETTTDGDPIHVAPGVFAAHFSPNTGHSYGDHKTDGVGFLPADDSEMEELVGDGVGDEDGICEGVESCAYWGELDGSGVRDRIPAYLSRRDGEVTSVLFVNGPTGVYFDDPPQWRVYIRFANGVSYDLDHVGTFEPTFAAAVEAASGCDPNSWSLCGLTDGSDLLEATDPIPVSAGQELCSPQTMAKEVPGYPGYYVGDGSWPRYPWVQMEFVVEALVDTAPLDICVYKLLAPSREEEMQALLDTDMLDPESQRYRLGLGFPQPEWQWGAEGRACNTEVNRPLDFSQLYSALGGWWERPEPGTTPNEIFSYAPIAKDVAIWDGTNYDPLDPEALVLRQRASGEPDFAWQMPDGSTLNPLYAAGELLDLTSDTMLVKWRDMGYLTPVYQRAAYLLDDDGLKVKWGVFSGSIVGATQPILTPLEPCDDLEVLCYSHEQHDGY